MWRQSTSEGQQEPAQSLSDEELDEVTYDYDRSAKLQSLCPHGDKVQLPVMSQLDLLKEKEDLPIYGGQEDSVGDGGSCTSLEYEALRQESKREGHNFFQSWMRKERHIDSGDESISDEENAVLSKFSFTSGSAHVHKTNHYKIETENQDEACMWSSVLEEADELVALQKKENCSSTMNGTSEARKVRGGVRDRAKLKFSIRSQSCKEVVCWSSGVKDENKKSFDKGAEGSTTRESLETRIRCNSVADLLGNLQEEKGEMPINLVIHEKTGAVPSVTEMLEDIREKSVPSNGSYDLFPQIVKAKEGKGQVPGKRTSGSLGARILDNEDPPEFMDVGTPSDDEEVDQNALGITTQKVKARTMADLFQEAFSTTEIGENLFHSKKQGGTDYYGRLQQVMQSEKDRHIEFMKQLQAGKSSFSDSRCIDVQIQSRVLEAKLTVCRCLFSDKTKSSQCWKSPQNADSRHNIEGTVIFSSKICDNVDLEVGNLVRIHPPWKEVHIDEDEKIVLCTFCSQIPV